MTLEKSAVSDKSLESKNNAITVLNRDVQYDAVDDKNLSFAFLWDGIQLLTLIWKSIFSSSKKMGDALFELEHTLRSRKEPMTLQEANVLMAWRAHAMRDFTVGFGGGSVVSWLATQRLRNLVRINVALGTGAAFGLLKFGRSVQSSVDHILSLEGSRIQRELANIMLKKYHRDPWAMQHLSKHFYSEEVYEDSSVDRPTFRWRYRNFSGEPVDHSQSTSYSEETHSNENDVKKTTMEPKQVFVNTSVDAVENPFDLIFGLSENAENVTNPVEPDTLSRKQRHKEKRSRRRHRRHHHHHHEDESEI